MATEDEVRRLILEVIGEDKVRSLKEQIDQEKQSLLALVAALGNLTPAQVAQDRQVQAATENLAAMNRQLHDMGGGGGGESKMSAVAQRAQAASYAFQDFTSASGDLGQKLNSISNNIPGMLAGMGSLATGVGVVATAAIALYKNWDLLTIGAEKAQEKHDQLTKSLKEQKEALEALDKVQTAMEEKQQKERIAGVAEAIAPHKEEVRKALAADIQADLEAETERLMQQTPGQDLAQRMQDPRFARVWRRRTKGGLGVQKEADLIIGRAIQGGRPELGRLRGLFGPETEIGARLAEAGPERAEQRVADERDVEQQRKMHHLDDQIVHQREQAVQKAAQLMGQSFTQEEQDLHRQQQADQHAAEQKRQAERREVQAKHKAAAAAEQKARRTEREFIEDVRLRADQAIAGGAPAGLVGQQANALFERMARSNGRTTDLSQAQARMMLHLQQVQERQERQNQETERKIQQFWTNATRTGK